MCWFPLFGWYSDSVNQKIRAANESDYIDIRLKEFGRVSFPPDKKTDPPRVGIKKDTQVWLVLVKQDGLMATSVALYRKDAVMCLMTLYRRST